MHTQRKDSAHAFARGIEGRRDFVGTGDEHEVLGREGADARAGQRTPDNIGALAHGADRRKPVCAARA